MNLSNEAGNPISQKLSRCKTTVNGFRKGIFRTEQRDGKSNTPITTPQDGFSHSDPPIALTIPVLEPVQTPSVLERSIISEIQPKDGKVEIDLKENTHPEISEYTYQRFKQAIENLLNGTRSDYSYLRAKARELEGRVLAFSRLKWEEDSLLLTPVAKEQLLDNKYLFELVDEDLLLDFACLQSAYLQKGFEMTPQDYVAFYLITSLSEKSLQAETTTTSRKELDVIRKLQLPFRKYFNQRLKFRLANENGNIFDEESFPIYGGKPDRVLFPEDWQTMQPEDLSDNDVIVVNAFEDMLDDTYIVYWHGQKIIFTEARRQRKLEQSLGATAKTFIRFFGRTDIGRTVKTYAPAAQIADTALCAAFSIKGINLKTVYDTPDKNPQNGFRSIDLYTFQDPIHQKFLHVNYGPEYEFREGKDTLPVIGRSGVWIDDWIAAPHYKEHALGWVYDPKLVSTLIQRYSMSKYVTNTQ